MELIIKNYTNILYWVTMVGLIVWFAYSKGWILANFENITAEQAYTLMENDDNVTLLDVRTVEEFKSHHVKDVQLIPLGELEKNLKKLANYKNKKDPCLLPDRKKKRKCLTHPEKTMALLLSI